MDDDKHQIGQPPLRRKPRPDLSTVDKRNAFYSSEEYRNMTTAEKGAIQGDGFINDYD